MARDTVGNSIKKNRTFIFLNNINLAAHSVDNGERIVTVDTLRVHLRRRNAGADSGEDAVCHGFAVCLSAHAV